MRCTNLRNIFEGFEDGDITIKGKEIGILCNCVHYLDQIMGELNIDDFIFVSEKSCIKKIINSKRKGYHLIKGFLTLKSQRRNITFTI